MRWTKKHTDKMVAIDLFSGGGGLTVGLKQAGFQVLAAVENDQPSIDTYAANHPEVAIVGKDIRDISGEELLALTPNHHVDLLAGCPPCQGFSSLTSKYKKRDPRNALIREFGRLVMEIQPRAIMMENVPGLQQKGHRLFNEFVKFIEGLGYVVTAKSLQVADYGVPQSRRRLVLLAGFGFKIDLPKPSHDVTGREGRRRWKTVRDVIHGLPRPLTLDRTWKKGGPQAHEWHVVRAMSALNVERLRKAKPGERWSKIPKRLRPDCHKDIAAGFPNVYGRMAWNAVSPTITGGCTTLSKGRFGHPSQLRTISVREAALLQTYPRNYKINTDYMEHACDIIGNGLPCRFAKRVAAQCRTALTRLDAEETA